MYGLGVMLDMKTDQVHLTIQMCSSIDAMLSIITVCQPLGK